MVLKRPFISRTREDYALHIHCSGLLRDRALPIDMIVLLKVVLKRLIIGDTGNVSDLYVHCSGLLGNRALQIDMIVLLTG